MKVVIEIYKEDFEEICMQARMVEDTGSTFGRIRKAIFHGTPLPEGHGVFKDVTPLMRGLYEEICTGEVSYNSSDVYKMIDEECSTIIEADN